MQPPSPFALLPFVTLLTSLTTVVLASSSDATLDSTTTIPNDDSPLSSAITEKRINCNRPPKAPYLRHCLSAFLDMPTEFKNTEFFPAKQDPPEQEGLPQWFDYEVSKPSLQTYIPPTQDYLRVS